MPEGSESFLYEQPSPNALDLLPFRQLLPAFAVGTDEAKFVAKARAFLRFRGAARFRLSERRR
jgi:hypothetical protein